ncbi:MAG: ThuA domain-containing protein [Vicinamibacterales bacterium]
MALIERAPSPCDTRPRFSHLEHRLRVLLFLGAVAALLITGGCGEDAAGPTTPSGNAAARVLVVTHTTGFRHDSIAAAETALRTIGSDSGLFETEFCRTAEDVRARLTPSGLASMDAVVFANTSGNLGVPDLAAFLSWIAGGKAFIGTHSASDTYHDSPDYLEMLGGEVLTHGIIVEAELRVNDATHPAVAHLAPRVRVTDEWYRFRLLGQGRTVLLSFDRNPPDGLGTPGEPVDLPIAWHKPHGSGRVFYTAMGHQTEVWNDQRFRTHLREGIRTALNR